MCARVYTEQTRATRMVGLVRERRCRRRSSLRNLEFAFSSILEHHLFATVFQMTRDFCLSVRPPC